MVTQEMRRRGEYPALKELSSDNRNLRRSTVQVDHSWG